MECEFFCKPGTDLDWFAYWKNYCENWLLSLGIKKEHLRLRDHEARRAGFLQPRHHRYRVCLPFTDWGELWGIADRTNYDLSHLPSTRAAPVQGATRAPRLAFMVDWPWPSWTSDKRNHMPTPHQSSTWRS